MLNQIDSETLYDLTDNRYAPLYMLKYMHDNGIDVSQYSFEINNEYDPCSYEAFCWDVLHDIFDDKKSVIFSSEIEDIQGWDLYNLEIIWENEYVAKAISLWKDRVHDKDPVEPCLLAFKDGITLMLEGLEFSATEKDPIVEFCLEDGNEGVTFTLITYYEEQVCFSVQFVEGFYQVLNACKDFLEGGS